MRASNYHAILQRTRARLTHPGATRHGVFCQPRCALAFTAVPDTLQCQDGRLVDPGTLVVAQLLVVGNWFWGRNHGSRYQFAGFFLKTTMPVIVHRCHLHGVIDARMAPAVFLGGSRIP